MWRWLLLIYKERCKNDEDLEKYSFIKVLLEIELPKLNLYIKDKEKLQEYKASGKTCLDLKECNECD